jgi:Holliday junction resolvasome RuvABC endonuclease subunit
MSKILGIDPGELKSGFVVYDSEQRKIYERGIIDNHNLIASIQYEKLHFDEVAIEMFDSFGMPVGAEVFKTIFWIGRFYQAAQEKVKMATLIHRKSIKMALCNTPRAKDSNIRQVLIDRFGKPGSKKNGENPHYQDLTYPKISSHIWKALAVFVVYTEAS